MSPAEALPVLLTDWNHWAFEFISDTVRDIIVIGLLWTPIRRWWANHHRPGNH